MNTFAIGNGFTFVIEEIDRAVKFVLLAFEDDDPEFVDDKRIDDGLIFIGQGR